MSSSSLRTPTPSHRAPPSPTQGMFPARSRSPLASRSGSAAGSNASLNGGGASAVPPVPRSGARTPTSGLSSASGSRVISRAASMSSMRDGGGGPGTGSGSGSRSHLPPPPMPNGTPKRPSFGHPSHPMAPPSPRTPTALPASPVGSRPPSRAASLSHPPASILSSSAAFASPPPPQFLDPSDFDDTPPLPPLPMSPSLSAATAAAAAAASYLPPGYASSPNRRENVQVSVRMRPLTADEAIAGGQVAWEVDSAGGGVSGIAGIRRPPGGVLLTPQPSVAAGLSAPPHEFLFDHAYTGSDNMELYSASVRELVYSAMEGYNGTVFAYGQTSSGKTFTMMGTPDAHGVIPQAVQDVFNYIKQSEGRREFLLRVSYLEIYNETIRDLLSPETRDLRIHEDKRRGVYVSPLKEEIVTTPAQVMRVISNGERNRSISTTDYNEHSSRSHTLFQMVIESRDPSTAGGSPPPGAAPGSGKTVKISSLNLIDLAGSEKAASNVDRRKEGSYINRSLLTLGTVIGKLTEEKATHIPYRDSKLTRILQSSLSGNARVSVICTISPSSANLDESTNTLKFAARVKQVVTRAHTNHVLDDKALLQKYRKEISELRERLQNTNEQFEVKHQLALMQIKAERDKVQEELHEQHLVRTALKERIDHLTRLILTSGSISQQTLTPVAPAIPGAPGMLPPRVEELNSTLIQKQTEIMHLQATIRDQRTQLAQYLKLTSALQDGDTDTAVQMARDVSLGSLNGSLSSLGLHPGGSGIMGTAPPPGAGLGGASSTESLVDINAEIVELKQRNRELDIVASDAEERAETAERDMDDLRAVWSDERAAMAEEIRDLKSALTRERARAANLEAAALAAAEFEGAMAATTMSETSTDVSTADTLVDLTQVRAELDRERAMRHEEMERHATEFKRLETELLLAKSELSVIKASSATVG